MNRIPNQSRSLYSTLAISIHTVAMTGRSAGDENASRVRAAVEDLMHLTGQDFKALTSLEGKGVLLYFEGQLSLDNIEELPRVNMEVTDFPGAGRHEFFNDAEVGCPDKVPAVAVVSVGTTPFVMRGGLPADDRCH
jgi:hypothetical protein